MDQPPLAIDASTLLNLLATGEAQSILDTLQGEKFICSAASKEVLYLRSANSDDPPENVSVRPLIDQGVLAEVTVGSAEEQALFVELAADLDDGEAMSIAICASRGWTLATDDKKARRIAGQLEIPVRLLATSELISGWAIANTVHPSRLQQVLVSVETRARFRPWSGYPLQRWWIESAAIFR